MRQFADEYPDFPFEQVPLAQLQEKPILQERLAKNALRSVTQPLGVAEYQTKNMIEELKSELASIDDLENTLIVTKP